MSLLGLLFILPFTSHATDPESLRDFCVADLKSPISVNGFPCKPAAQVTSNDFFLDLSKESNSSYVFKRVVTLGDVLNSSAISTLEVTLTRIDLGVGAINPPHTHASATEAGIVLRGKVVLGFITTNNIFFLKILTPGMMFLIPRALFHTFTFSLMLERKKVSFLANFNRQNPGISDSSATLFSINPPVPNEMLKKVLLVGDDDINAIKAAQPSNQQGHQFGPPSGY